MYRIGVLLAGLAAGLLLAGEGLSGDKATQPKGKTRLPLYWSQLKLSAEQLTTIKGVQKSYGGKLAELKQKMDNLKKQEQEELLKVLSAEQKDQLRRILATKSGLDAPPKDRKVDPKDKKGG